MSRDQVAGGAQVAQHGGETGEANDWCRLHGLALHPLFPLPLRLPANPSFPTRVETMYLYFYTFVVWPTAYTCNHPPRVIKDANRSPLERCVSFDEKTLLGGSFICVDDKIYSFVQRLEEAYDYIVLYHVRRISIRKFIGEIDSRLSWKDVAWRILPSYS